MKKTKMQKLMSSTNLILQGRRILALVLVATIVFTLFGVSGLDGKNEVVSAGTSVNRPTSGAVRVVLDTFDEMRGYKKNLNKELGDLDNPIMILEVVKNQSNGNFGYMIGGCEPIDLSDPVVRNTDSIVYDLASVFNYEMVSIYSNAFFFADEGQDTDYTTGDYSHYEDEYDVDGYNGVNIDEEGNYYVNGYYERVVSGNGYLK